MRCAAIIKKERERERERKRERVRDRQTETEDSVCQREGSEQSDLTLPA